MFFISFFDILYIFNNRNINVLCCNRSLVNFDISTRILSFSSCKNIHTYIPLCGHSQKAHKITYLTPYILLPCFCERTYKLHECYNEQIMAITVCR